MTKKINEYETVVDDILLDICDEKDGCPPEDREVLKKVMRDRILGLIHKAYEEGQKKL